MSFIPDDSIQTKFRNVSFLCTSATRTGGRKIDVKSLMKSAIIPEVIQNISQEFIPGISNLPSDGSQDYNPSYRGKSAGVSTSASSNSLNNTNKNISNITTAPTYHFITQDLGIEVPTIKLTALFYGPRYTEIRDEMLNALELGTPGELQFLNHGTLTVLARNWTNTYSSTEFQYEKMEIEFVLHDYVDPDEDTGPDVYADYLRAEAEKANASWIKDANSFENQAFRFNSNTEKTAFSDSIQQSAATMKSSMSKIRKAAEYVNNTYEAAIAAIDEIFEFADELVDDLGALQEAIDKFIVLIPAAVTSRVDAYVSMIEMSVKLGERVLNVPGNIKERLLNSFFRLGAIFGASKELDKFSFASVTEIETVKKKIFDELDDIARDMADYPSFAQTYTSIVQVRGAVFKVLSAKLAALPNLITIYIKRPIPVEVLAYQLYGDATRADDILRRNNIQNSLFVQGTITVLEN